VSILGEPIRRLDDRPDRRRTAPPGTAPETRGVETMTPYIAFQMAQAERDYLTRTRVAHAERRAADRHADAQLGALAAGVTRRFARLTRPVRTAGRRGRTGFASGLAR
jgi:hypothetical protein